METVALWICLTSTLLSDLVSARPANSITQNPQPDGYLAFLQSVNNTLTANAVTTFPPGFWLGFGLDMTSVMPLDIYSVRESVTRNTRLIKVDGKTSGTDIPGLGNWAIPDGVTVSSDVGGGDGELITFAGGQSAAAALSGGGSIQAKYKVIKGDATVDVGVAKNFQDSYQYGFFDFHHTMFDVNFAGADGYEKLVNEDNLLFAIHRLPTFDASKPENLQAYRDLFSSIGTHVIIGVTYGSRLTFTFWGSNSDSEVNSNFKGDLNVALGGLPYAGKMDAHLEESEQYKTFTESVQKTCSCNGGDVPLAISLCAGGTPNLADVYSKWTKTAEEFPDATNFEVVAIWELMRNAQSDKLASFATPLESAFHQLSNHPQVHYTSVVMIVSSDWAEFGLLSPSAYVDVDPAGEQVPGTVLSSTKVGWQSPSGAPGRDITISFIIRNFGGPVDIELSHGSNGATPDSGSVSVVFSSGCKQTAQGVHDNNWNTERFTCIVDPKGVDTPMPPPSNDAVHLGPGTADRVMPLFPLNSTSSVNTSSTATS